VVVYAAGNDPRYRLVAVANQHFFAVLYELDVSAELRFQVANVYGTHTHIVTNLTMLVMSVLAFRYATRSRFFGRNAVLVFEPSREAALVGWHHKV
jgi:hypothetical protein